MSRTPEESPPLLAEAARRAERYLAGIDARDVAPTADALARLVELGGAWPQSAMDPGRVLALLDDIASPATMVTTGGRYFGLVVGGAQPAALAAAVLAVAWDQVAGMVHAAPGASAVEEIALGWVTEALDLPRDCAGGFVSGATMGNFCALAAARHVLLERHGWDVERQGLFGAPPLTVAVGAEVHRVWPARVAPAGAARRYARAGRQQRGAQGRDAARAQRCGGLRQWGMRGVGAGYGEDVGRLGDALRARLVG